MSRGSLLEGTGLESGGGGRSSRGGGGKSGKDAMKLTIAIVLLVIAGVVIAWNFGLFSDPSADRTPSAVRDLESKPEAIQERQRQEQERERIQRDPNTTTGGA